jgi:hypothetical protein
MSNEFRLLILDWLILFTAKRTVFPQRQNSQFVGVAQASAILYCINVITVLEVLGQRLISKACDVWSYGI